MEGVYVEKVLYKLVLHVEIVRWDSFTILSASRAVQKVKTVLRTKFCRMASANVKAHM